MPRVRRSVRSRRALSPSRRPALPATTVVDETGRLSATAADEAGAAEAAIAADKADPAGAAEASGTPSDGRAQASEGAAGGALTLLRARWHVITVTAVVLLAIGVGAGWALFGNQSDEIPLTDAQQQRKLELYEDGGYDEDSVRAVGQDDDALVWYGTRNDGENVCLVLDVGAETGQACQRSDELGTGIFGLSAMTVIPGEGDTPSTSVMAYMTYSTSGGPLVSIQRWDQSYGVLDQFVGEDRARAEELMHGDEAVNLAVVGYFRGEPVWLIERWEGNGSEVCLVVDGARRQSSCRPHEDAISDGLAVYASDDEALPGEAIEASMIWKLEVDYTPTQTPYLMIIRDPESLPGSMGGDTRIDGSRLHLGGEYGDPIEVVPPTTDSRG